jgi:hypothetical protein
MKATCDTLCEACCFFMGNFKISSILYENIYIIYVGLIILLEGHYELSNKI